MAPQKATALFASDVENRIVRLQHQDAVPSFDKMTSGEASDAASAVPRCAVAVARRHMRVYARAGTGAVAGLTFRLDVSYPISNKATISNK